MQGIFQKENTDKALKYGIYRHLPTYEKIIRNLVSFYTKILEQIRVVKAYIMSYLHDLDDNFKYKSKTYAASLGTTEHPMENTEITLKMEGFDDYKIPLQVFKRYEYIDKLTKVKEEG